MTVMDFVLFCEDVYSMYIGIKLVGVCNSAQKTEFECKIPEEQDAIVLRLSR